MKSKKFVLALVLSVVLMTPLAAEATSYLSQPLLDKFIKTYPALQLELQSLDPATVAEIDLAAKADDFEPYEVDAARKFIKQAGAHASIQAILRKHGWGPEFWDVMVTIAYGQMFIELEAMLKVYATDEMIELVDTLGLAIHPADRRLIAANKERLDEVMHN